MAIWDSNKPLAFTDEEFPIFFQQILGEVISRDYNPLIQEELKLALTDIYHIQHINIPKNDTGNMYLSTHVSDMDAINFSLYHQNMLIFARPGWVSNDELVSFFSYFRFLAVARKQDNGAVQQTDFREFRSHMKKGGNSLILPQGTISDIRNNAPERLPGATYLRYYNNYSIYLVLAEYPSEDGPTRYIYAEEPLRLPSNLSRCDYAKFLLEEYQKMIEKLHIPLREPVLTLKHSCNNNSKDLYF